MTVVLILIIVLMAFVILGQVMKSRFGKYDGTVRVLETSDKKTFSLEINGDPDKLDQKKQIVLRVVASD